MSKTYIHYGNDHFDINKMKNLIIDQEKNQRLQFVNKCAGFWASPTDSDWAWKEWCESEDYHTERLETHFTFTLKPETRVLYVESSADIEAYTKECDLLSFRRYIDFDKIKKEYDALEICHDKNYCDLHDSYFYTWDVDSILIWNPDIIVELHEERSDICKKIA